MDIIECRKTSQAFRRVSSNMLTTKYEDGNIQLIRFRKFIEENKLINNMIQEKIKNIDYNYKDNFIIEDNGWYNISIPIDEHEHIKAMYDYLADVTNEENDIRVIALSFYPSSNKLNDIIREYLNKAFKPLVDFIVDSLSMEVIGIESIKSETNIYQNIDNNYGTASIAQGNINSSNKFEINDLNDINEIVKSIKELIVRLEIDENTKEEVMDDLETIEQEIKLEKPKKIRIKKALNGIKNFTSKIPEGLAKATIIVTHCRKLYNQLKAFI